MNSNKDKLLYIAPQNPYPPIDGGKISIYYPLVNYAKYYNVYFAYISNKKSDIFSTLIHFKEKDIVALPFFRNIKFDFLYLIKNIFNSSPFKWDKYYSKNIQKNLNSIIEKENIKYILVSHPHMAKYAIKAKELFPEVKIFMREHNIEFKLVEQFKNFTKNKIYKKIANWQLEKTKRMELEYWNVFEKIFFISDKDFDIAKSLTPNISNKFEVLYDGYELKTMEPITSITNSFIYTANLKIIQNYISFKWFIEKIWLPSINFIKEYNIKLYISGNEEKIFKKICGFAYYEKYNIINLGYVENIDEEILKHKYVLSPTIIGSGIRLKVLNGMACGKPVFLTPFDLSTAKIFKDFENVISFSNKEEFLNKIIMLEKDQDLYLNVARNAIETIKDYFSWDKYVEKIYNSFKVTKIL